MHQIAALFTYSYGSSFLIVMHFSGTISIYEFAQEFLVILFTPMVGTALCRENKELKRLHQESPCSAEQSASTELNDSAARRDSIGRTNEKPHIRLRHFR